MRYLVFITFYWLIGLGITAVSPHHPTAELNRERQVAILLWPATVAARVWGDYLANHPRSEPAPKGDRQP